MRAPVDTIEAPPFLPQLRWVNVKRVRMEQLRGRPVLIEFWDFCRPNSMRTLPYLKAWHERYGGPPPDPTPRRRDAGADAAGCDAAGNGGGNAERNGGGGTEDNGGGDDETASATGGARFGPLQVLGIHSPGFQPARDRKAVIAAVQRLAIEYPVMIDSELEMWREYENLGWPARYLFGPDGMLFDYHYGEGAYQETELAIQELMQLEDPPAPLAPLRPEDAPGATLAPQTEDREGLYEGPYEAGGVWAVLDGAGTLVVNGGEHEGGRIIEVDHPGAYALIEHERHKRSDLRLEPTGEVRCLATCFTPGLAA